MSCKGKVERVIDKAKTCEALADELSSENAILSARIEELEAAGSTEEIENIIDNSGVLDSTDGTAKDKVKQLIDKGNIENFYYQRTSTIKNASDWFNGFNGEKLPRSNFVNATIVVNFARSSTIIDVDYYLNWGAESTATINATGAFNNTVNLTHMVGVKTDKCTNISGFFGNSAIEEVDKPFNLSSITQSSYLKDAFSCSKLREVRFEENSIKVSITFLSPVLSEESITSILNGLYPYDGNGEQPVLTLNSDVWDIGLTEAHWEILSTKNWGIY